MIFVLFYNELISICEVLYVGLYLFVLWDLKLLWNFLIKYVIFKFFMLFFLRRVIIIEKKMS